MRFDPNARRCSYCGRWGSELTCRGCGGPHSPDDDRALVTAKEYALLNYSRRDSIDRALQHPMTDSISQQYRLLQEYEASVERSTVPSVIVTHDDEGNEETYESFAAYNRAIERGRDPGLINWRM